MSMLSRSSSRAPSELAKPSRYAEAYDRVFLAMLLYTAVPA